MEEDIPKSELANYLVQTCKAQISSILQASDLNIDYDFRIK